MADIGDLVEEDLIDKDLLQYCKENNYPVEEMSENDFIIVQGAVGFTTYKLGLQLRDLGKEVLKAMKKIEHRKKSCKNFKCK